MGVWLLVIAVLTLGAYSAMFTGWAGFDDEGFFDYSLKMFLQGHPMYTAVGSAYGPFYYLVFGLIFKVAGVSVTTDAGRMVTLVVWIVCSSGIGLLAQRVSGNLFVGIAVTFGVYLSGSALIGSPMHAQIAALLLALAIAAVALVGLERWARAAPAAIGALVCALALSKVNLGGYAFVAIGAAIVFRGPRWLRRRWFLLPAAVAFVVLAPVVMASEWSNSYQRTYALVVAGCSLALTVVAWPSPECGESWPRDFLWWFLGGIAALGALVLVALVATGTHLGDWIQQTIIAPTHQASLLEIELGVGLPTLYCMVAGIVLAAAVRAGVFRRWLSAGQLLVTSGCLRVAAALVLLLPELGLFHIVSLVPGLYPYGLAWPLLWLAAVPPVSSAARWQRLGRVIVVALTISQSLMAYPVAGAQVELGGLLFLLCAAAMLADGISDLNHWAGLHHRRAIMNRGLTAMTAAVAIAVIPHTLNIESQARDGYRATYALNGKGAGHVRAVGGLANSLDLLVSAVHKQGCRTLMELPGQYSFNLWTGVPTPLPMTAEQSYWLTLSASQQLQVLSAARSAPRMCLIVDPEQIPFYTAGKPLPDVPLIRFLRTDFRTVATVPGWELRVRDMRRR